ncbi:hypothetical protein AAMO2058_000647900 [Amorphochlora amoebiformis]
MWSETPELAEFKENALAEKRREITNQVKCKKVTECRSYDEFKEHVAAAFLKPIDLRGPPKDTLSKLTSTTHNKNLDRMLEKASSSDVCEKLSKELESISICDLKCPKNSFQFDSQWRLLKTSKEKVGYLQKIHPEKYKSIFRVSGSFTELGDAIVALCTERVKMRLEYDKFIIDTLRGISMIKEFHMAVAFLDEELEILTKLRDDLVSDYKGSKAPEGLDANEIEKIVAKYFDSL